MEESELTCAPAPDVERVDLRAYMLAQMLAQAHAALREVRTAQDPRTRQAVLPGAAQIDVLIDLAQQGSPCRAFCAYLVRIHSAAADRAEAYRAQVRAYEAERRAFFEGLCAGMTWVGSERRPASWTVIGWQDNPRDLAREARPVAISRDAGLVLLCAGIQGAGKSVLCTALCEGFLQDDLGLCSGEAVPTACAVFHVEEQDRLPQQLEGLRQNPSSAELEILAARLGVGPATLSNLRLFMPRHVMPRYEEVLGPYRDLGLEVAPLQVHLGELGQWALEAALGAEDGARYVQRMLDDAEAQGDGLNLRDWHTFIDDAEDLNSATKRAAHERLRGLSKIASPPDEPGLWHMVRPGDRSIFFLGGPHIGLRHVVPVLVGLMSAMVMPSPEHGAFKRVILVDEINRFDQVEVVWRVMITLARKVRHYAVTLGLFGQDLLAVPDEFIGLAALCIVFRLINPKIFEDIRARVGSFSGVRFEEVMNLKVGEALLAAALCTDPAWQRRARKVILRMLRCMHGGRSRKVA